MCVCVCGGTEVEDIVSLESKVHIRNEIVQVSMNLTVTTSLCLPGRVGTHRRNWENYTAYKSSGRLAMFEASALPLLSFSILVDF